MPDRSLLRVLRVARNTGRIALLADVKMRSPRDGPLVAPERLEWYVGALIAGGVDALATPTDPVHFGGSVEIGRRIRRLCDLPLMRKEFFTAVEQMDASKEAGFDAVHLSVATAPTPELLHAMAARAEQVGLEVVIGVHERDELELAMRVGAVAVGVNNRDITALERDDGTVDRAGPLLAGVPRRLLVISESGLRSPADVASAAAAGADAVLVGAALARSADPAAMVATLKAGVRR